jgi:hypothetical protein
MTHKRPKGVLRGSYAWYHGKAKFIVVAYHTKGKSTDRIILGPPTTYKLARKLVNRLHEYKNVQGHQIFTGGAVLTVPEWNILPSNETWKYMYLKEPKK